MLDILSALFESLVSFLETIVSLVTFVTNNVGSLFTVFNYVPPILRGPCIMALTIIIVLGIKRAVLV